VINIFYLNSDLAECGSNIHNVHRYAHHKMLINHPLRELADDLYSAIQPARKGTRWAFELN
jgi:hypothetical protein